MKTKSLLLSLITIFVLVLSSCAAPTAAPQPAPTQPAQQEQAEPTEAAPEVEPSNTPVAIEASEATATPAPTAAPEAQYKEAPALADRVASGDLPPVEERLPVSPLVTTPVESIGKYGGTMHVASGDPNFGDIKMYLTEPPIKWKADLTGYEPGLAESYEWSEDGKTFTLHMRRGLKWSDGEPYTSADWQFWWEDMANAPDQNSYSVPAWLRNNDGTPIVMEFPDEYTVVWKASDRALWIDPYFLAQGFWEFADPRMKPAHYLKQFHPKYADDGSWDKIIEVDKWWSNPDFPCLMAWCLEERAEDGTRFTFARNPYYYRVDTEGNQLPYIDYFNIEIVPDDQVRLLNAAQGKYDAMFRGLGSPNNIPFLQETAEDNGYHLLDGWMAGSGAWPGYFINMDYVEGGKNYPNDTADKATEIRNLLRDKRFRQALSVGIDRQRIIDVVWRGIGEPKGYTLSPQAWHFASPEGQEVYKRWAQSYIETNFEKANALLDELGMTIGADGFRTLPSGEPFNLIIDVTDWGGDLPVNLDSSTELKEQWGRELKLNVTVNNLQGQPIVDTRFNEGYYMLRPALFAEVDIWTFPDQIFPIRNRYMFPLQGRWYEKGGDTCVEDPDVPYSCGIKPEPGSLAEQLQVLYQKGLSEKDLQKRHEIVWEAIALIEEEGPVILSVSGDQPAAALATDVMRNILNFGVTGPWAPATPGNQVPAQWWMDL